MTIQPGTQVGPYEVQEPLGQGAMGLVYKAWHAALARPAAVKVLQALAPDPEAAARFRREAQSIAQMRHPNVLNVFDFGQLDGVPYMVVEFVPGGSLADRLKRGRVSGPDAVRILRGVAAALDYAHGLGVVHRDVKPANVLMHGDGTPVLADFGLAKLLQSSSVKSMTGATTGTPSYMAPEQVEGRTVGPAADNYALATMAYELLTGSLPFEAEGVLEVLYAQVHRDPAPPTERAPELPPAVDAVLLRGLAKDPDARWTSCGEMVDALERALATPAPAAAAAPRRPAPEATMVLPPPPARRRRATVLVALGLVAVLLAGIVAAVLLARSGGPSVSLSNTAPRQGEEITFTAHRLPADQAGEVAIDTAANRVGSFQADATGDASGSVRIPLVAPTGRHSIKLCWSTGCHAAGEIDVRPRTG